jgi:hypothetical protein
MVYYIHHTRCSLLKFTPCTREKLDGKRVRKAREKRILTKFDQIRGNHTDQSGQ